MRELDLFDEESGTTVFRDIIMLALAGFVTLVMLLIPHIHPDAVSEDTDKAPGNMIIELRWPDDLNVDVDLWVQAPGDKPVGYLNKNGQVFDLLRDDLGKGKDLTALNYEFAYSRGAPAGEYIVNVHLYRDKGAKIPIPATVAVSLKSSGAKVAKEILASDVTLNRAGEEMTVFRFKLDENSRFIASSVHDLPKRLRNVM